MKKVCSSVNVPVIVNSGAGLLVDLVEVVQMTNASAVAVAFYLHSQTINLSKQSLHGEP